MSMKLEIGHSCLWYVYWFVNVHNMIVKYIKVEIFPKDYFSFVYNKYARKRNKTQIVGITNANSWNNLRKQLELKTKKH